MGFGQREADFEISTYRRVGLDNNKSWRMKTRQISPFSLLKNYKFCFLFFYQFEHLNMTKCNGPFFACKNVPSSCVTSRPKLRPTITNQPPKYFLSIYFLISYAIYC